MVRLQRAISVAAIVAAAALLFLTAPRTGEFWWSDAPRHALNGAFILDLLRDLPIEDPRGWAVDYYYRYPALTILFYPPLLPALAALVFAAVGVSPWSAQLTVSLLVLVAGLGAWAIARRWMPAPAALAVALLFLGLPEVGLWGRQVMLELPAYAFLLWAVWAFLRYLDVDGRRPGWLYLALLLFGAALYTKQSVMFVAPVLALIAVQVRGLHALLRDRHVWIGSTVFLVGLAPLVYMTVAFGVTNLQSVAGVQDAVTSRWSAANWLFYARLLPAQMGWPLAAVSLLALASMIVRPRLRPPRVEWTLTVAWLAVGYVFFSSISLKEQRLDIFLLFPLVLVAVQAAHATIPRRVLAMLPLAGVALLVATALWRPVPFVAGYAEAAEFVVAEAEPESIVLFSGLRDGSFIFNLRSHEQRGDLMVIRADKLLLRVAVRRGLGVEEQRVEQAAFAERLNRLGVRYVVADPQFWSDLENMQMLQRILASDQFELVRTIPVRSNVSYAETEIRIYRNLGPVARDPEPFTMRLEMIDTTLQPGH